MTRSSTYEELTDAIAAAFSKLSPQLQQIARFALERPNELALGTVATVAEAADVQPSALIRFANRLEFAGFSDMQQLFRARLLERSGSYRERIGRMRRDGGAGSVGAAQGAAHGASQGASQGAAHGAARGKGRGTHAAAAADAGVLHQFVGDAVDELSHLEDNVRAADLAAAARLICAAARVHVLAQRRAFPIACYLAYALGQLELKTQLLAGLGGMLGESLRGVDARDVLLVASFQPYSPDVIEAARTAHARGVPVIAITDSALSPLKVSAKVCFELGQGPNPAFRSLVAPLCLAQALVISAGQRLTAPKQRAENPAAKASPNGSRRVAATKAAATKVAAAKVAATKAVATKTAATKATASRASAAKAAA
jgi:DNA-binding MurR/RpiR family transcriptional regulator